MPDTYRIETWDGNHELSGPVVYDTTKNGQRLFTDLDYIETTARLVKLLADDDVYQEVCNDEMYCTISGAEMKKQFAECDEH